ncbi:DUF2785 domain-containing protein [Streptomyces sp. NBC_01108]|uniref:DUF2785 domain-containing protein n=1 Tax=Streptomyces sp. NBC_01108 TaxID=2903751 RepID=UPI00387365A2|nr:DUF2785 domain-containing protein [Streptomyces sp. NBC_01108]
MNIDLVDWASIAADGFPFPEGVPASRLAAELSAMLVSADPEIRDDYAYTGVAQWIKEGHFDEVLQALGDTAATRFSHPEVQARTFAPLVLCSVLTRGNAVPGLVPKEAVERWFARFSTWYLAEQDTRGWDDSLGWLHAVAHGADAAAAFAKALPDRRTELLELCARRMTAQQTDYRYSQLEDARLARALTRILQAPGLKQEEATGWLTVVVAALDGIDPGPAPVWAFNTFATLQSLHLHLTRGLADEGIPPHADAVAIHACDLLRVPYRWLA